MARKRLTQFSWFGCFICYLMLPLAVQADGVVSLPNETPDAQDWSVEDRSKPIAIRHLYRSAGYSTHLIRIQDAEKPHVHDRHDLTVTLLTGRMVLHFDQRDVTLVPGDVVVIPLGRPHWAENVAEDASVAFVSFAPGFDGKDRRLLTAPEPSK